MKYLIFRVAAMATGLLGTAAVPVLGADEVRVGLGGSPASMERQHEIAKDSNLPFARTTQQVRELVAAGKLVELNGNDDYSFIEGRNSMIGRPEMRLFVERLAAQYRAACGEQLVLTSMTRPMSQQPRNSHPLSVHPTGMAVDLRVSKSTNCRSWLESTLLSLERQEFLDVTREHWPPHYHVALFSEPYLAYVQKLETATAQELTEAGPVTELGMVAAQLEQTQAQLAGVAQSPADSKAVVLLAVPLLPLAFLLVRRRLKR